MGVGPGFFAELMDAEVCAVVGPRARNPKFYDEQDILLIIAGARESTPGGSPYGPGPPRMALGPIQCDSGSMRIAPSSFDEDDLVDRLRLDTGRPT